jgi:hypothetical protein
MAKEREEKGSARFLTSMKLGPEAVSHFLKSVPFHAIDLRQIEPSYKVRLPWFIYSVFSNRAGNGGSNESKKSRASMPKRSREELLACLRAILAGIRIQIATRHEQQPRAI